VLTTSELEKRLAPETRTLCVDQDGWREEASEALGLEVDPESVAYVLYTSGSTGKPKGVEIRHRNATNLVTWAKEEFTAEEARGVLASTSLCFDLSVFELNLAWGHGGAVILASNALELPKHGAAERVTLLNTVPSVMAALLEHGPLPSGVRCVNLAGEALPGALVQRLYEQPQVERVCNAYGPTETTTYSTFAVMGRELKEAPSIGWAIADTQVYVLDEKLEPVPRGATGELYIGGAGVALGYCSRPALTAERFVPNPFESGRLYRTGDLGRHRADGSLEYLGRIDEQVKLRGYRIELGEIEHELQSVAGVSRAAAAVRERGRAELGSKQLVGYLVLEAKSEQDEREVLERAKKRLGETLPEYMRPSALVVLGELPLNANGKLDRKALPEPDWGDGQSQAEPAQTPTERVLAQIWSELLGVGEPGRQAHFFELGGHSLLAMQVVARVGAALQVEAPVRLLFEAPTLAALAERVDLLRRQQPGLRLPPIQRVAGEGSRLASFAQQRLWFMDQFDPAQPTYSVPIALRLQGELDSAALELALGDVVERHEALRTTFQMLDGQLLQRVAPARPAPLRLHSLEASPPAERYAELCRVLEAEARQPFDLAQDVLLRALLVRLDPEEHVLLLVSHHIALDGTHGLLLRELCIHYTARCNGEKAKLPTLALSYADFADRQRRCLSDGGLAEQRAYWLAQFRDGAPVLNLPADRPRPARKSYRGARFHFTLPARSQHALLQLGRGENATLFMTLLATLQVHLHRVTQQSSVCVGVPIVNNHQQDLEGVLGCFMNTLPLRAELHATQSFRDVLRSVRELTLGAYQNQDLPFEQLVEALGMERSLSHTPLFQVMFTLGRREPLELPRLVASPVAVDTGRARFDMLWALEEAPGGIDATIEYDTDLFDEASVARWVSQFECLIEHIVSAPDEAIARLALLTPLERERLTVGWNDTQRDYAGERCLHELFEAQVRRAPDAVAAVDGDGNELSYRRLNEQANRVARLLIDLGVEPGQQVAVCMDRSLALLPALLGTLKAGAAYVPLDAGAPPLRMQRILSSLRVAHVLTGQAQLDLIAQQVNPREALAPAATEVWRTSGLAHVVCLDEPGPALASRATRQSIESRGARVWSLADLGTRAASDINLALRSDTLAYVLFTSGSSGTPKGVMVQHRPLINLIEWAARELSLSAADRALFVTSLGFDLSVFDIFGLLAVGGSIRIASDVELRDPERLAQILVEEPISFWNSAPAALQQLLPFIEQRAERARRAALRLVLASGDWVPLPLPEQLRALFPCLEVVALGGATEAAVWSNFHRVGAIDHDWVSIPYGRPIQNARYLILDEQLEPCPVNVAGDLYIGGDCLALGYAADPRQTAAKFIPDPFVAPGSRAGARLYATGDRARFWSDGTIEFLGRVDSQIKLRGFRIELGEIETLLAAHPAVRDAVVIVRGNSAAGKHLVAFVVPHEAGSSVTGTALRGWLRAALPPYMIPASVRVLDSLPLTANGKLDRNALLALEPGPELPLEQLAARPSQLVGSFCERRVATIWQQVLGATDISLDDNFFELGGNSLLQVEVHRRLREWIPELAIVELFNHTTVATLAAYLQSAFVVPSSGRASARLSSAEAAGQATRAAGRERQRRRLEQRQQKGEG
jgi:amino acid adenylation domain-containing protein